MIGALDIIAQNVLWNRLISVCEEQANALMRAAFGAIVREAGDLSAGVFDASGLMLAQAVTGTPGHVNTMAASVNAMLNVVPAESLKPSDALVTNDPWLGAGHVFDFVVVTPAFLNGTIIGYLASTSHIVDVGGRGWSAGPSMAALWRTVSCLAMSELMDSPGRRSKALVGAQR